MGRVMVAHSLPTGRRPQCRCQWKRFSGASGLPGCERGYQEDLPTCNLQLYHVVSARHLIPRQIRKYISIYHPFLLFCKLFVLLDFDFCVYLEIECTKKYSFSNLVSLCLDKLCLSHWFFCLFFFCMTFFILEIPRHDDLVILLIVKDVIHPCQFPFE